MALILKLLEEAQNPVKPAIDESDLVYGKVCTNPKCISSTEQELPHISRITDASENICRCIYCEQRV
jgi:aspartate carbamoyltransferase regulatory subunit